MAPDAPILVVCPRCGGMAQARDVRSEPIQPGTTRSWFVAVVRVSCTACGLSREGRNDHLGDGYLRLRFGRDSQWRLDRRLRRHRRWPRAEVEDFPLFLRAECCGGHVLWARNAEHLDRLEAWVGSSVRSTYGWRLPRWIQEAKHRDEVLRHLAEMRAALA
jgi:hypothetical protein